MTPQSHSDQSKRWFALFAGQDLAVDFGQDAEAALDYMAEHADDLVDADVALMVWSPRGSCEVALIDARKASLALDEEEQR